MPLTDPPPAKASPDWAAARARFDAGLIPGMRDRLADAYATFRASEAQAMAAMSPAAAPYHSRDCPLCDTPPPDHVTLTGHGVELVDCPACGFTYAREVMDSAADAARYAASDVDAASLALRCSAPYLELETERARYYLARLATGDFPAGRLLDIGAGTGALVLEAERAGWQAQGLEPGVRAAARARSFGAKVADGYFPAALAADAVFDAITLLDVLEHFERPQALLADVGARLAPQGRVFAQVPNWESLLVRLEGGASSTVCPGHWSYFTAETLVRLMAHSGFRPVLVETVVSEIDRIARFPLADRVRTLASLRPGIGAQTLDAEALHAAGLGYKLIGVFERG